MQKLKISLQDCYGIGHLDHEFSFEPWGPHREAKHSQTAIVYARNGAMKTSFARTLDDVAHGREPQELIHGHTPHYSILADGVPFPTDAIFVVQAQGEYFESGIMGTLLADKPTQEAYAKIITGINHASDELLDGLKNKLGTRSTIEDVQQRFDKAFGVSESTRLQKLAEIAPSVTAADSSYLQATYKTIDDSDVDKFLDKPDTHELLGSYFQTYQKIIKDSEYFKDFYDYDHGLKVQDAVAKNNFFEAENSLTLSNGRVVQNAKELKLIYEQERDRIFATPELKAQYQAFDKAIRGNAKLRALRDFSQDHPELVPFLQQKERFKQSIWFALLQDSDGRYEALIKLYEAQRQNLDDLYKRSEAAQTKWHEVVDRFNEAFRMPFRVKITNQRDAILNQDRPALAFFYEDGRGAEKPVERSLLIDEKVLSTGEIRALYILCVMFELESRITTGTDHLIIIDDIAESFDYKNKYAILEYLNHLSRDTTNGLHMIILTHNFDFYRCVRSRFWGVTDRTKTAVALRDTTGTITLLEGGSIDEFKRFRQTIGSDQAIFLASIPFARNLIEYAQGETDPHYQTLTTAMHCKAATAQLTVADVAEAVESALSSTDLTAYKTSTNFLTTLQAQAAAYAGSNDETKLEYKIVIAMATRLAAEQYIAARFAKDSKPLNEEPGMQTGVWVTAFENEYGSHDVAFKTLASVMLMTPESIHLNSFMYEPIMDMSQGELAKLYDAVCKLP